MNEQCCRAHIQALERSARAGEAECEAAVARRADIAKQQATAWQAAAQATAQLQTAQQQKAAKAAKQAQKVKERLFFMTSARKPDMCKITNSSHSTLLFEFGNEADRTQPFLCTPPPFALGQNCIHNAAEVASSIQACTAGPSAGHHQ